MAETPSASQAAREHELCNALTVAEAAAQLLELTPGDVETARALRGALRTVRRLAVPPGSRTRAPAEVAEVLDLADVLDGCLRLVRPCGLRVDGSILAGLRVQADRQATHQVLLNVFGNVLQHGGGRAWVTATVRPGRVEVRIRDAGPGLPAHVAARLVRGGDVPPMGPGPHGLGLPLSVSLARRQGGDLWAAPAPGGGTVVTLALPAAVPHAG